MLRLILLGKNVRYPPTVVACFCIHLACKWSNYKIPLSAQNKEWFVYVDAAATQTLLDQLTDEFLVIYDQCPSRLKKKIKASTEAVSRNLPKGGRRCGQKRR
jgi:cyclin T